MPRRKKNEKTTDQPSKIFKKRKKQEPLVKPEDIKHLHAMLEQEDEQEIEKEIKQVLRERRQKLRHQVATMESRNKRLLMWVGVVAVMLIIISFWVVKFNEIVDRPVVAIDQEVQDIDFDKAKEELTATMEKVRQGIEEIKTQAEQLEQEKTQEGDSLAGNEVSPESAIVNQTQE